MDLLGTLFFFNVTTRTTQGGVTGSLYIFKVRYQRVTPGVGVGTALICVFVTIGTVSVGQRVAGRDLMGRETMVHCRVVNSNRGVRTHRVLTCNFIRTQVCVCFFLVYIGGVILRGGVVFYMVGPISGLFHNFTRNFYIYLVVSRNKRVGGIFLTIIGLEVTNGGVTSRPSFFIFIHRVVRSKGASKGGLTFKLARDLNGGERTHVTTYNGRVVVVIRFGHNYHFKELTTLFVRS